MVYWFLLTAAMILSFGKLYQFYVGKMYQLKMEKGWLTGRRRTTILVDTAASRDKKRMPVPLALQLLPSLLGFASAAFYWLALSGTFGFSPGLSEGERAMWGGLTASCVAFDVLCLLAVRLIAGSRNVVYGKDSRENKKANREEKGIYGKGLVGGSLLVSFFHGAALTGRIVLSNSSFLWLSVGAWIAGIFIIFLAAVFGRKKRGETAEKAEEAFTVDEDYYWRKGYYSNPNDPSVLVTKRTGYGMELNMAHKGTAAVLCLCLFGILILIFGRSVFPLIRLSGQDFSLEKEGCRILIQSPSYGGDFSLNEVIEIKLQNQELTGVLRTNGYSGGGVQMGNFRCREYGDGRWYLHKENPWKVQIFLADGSYVLINCRTEEETKRLYEQMNAWIEERAGGKPAFSFWRANCVLLF